MCCISNGLAVADRCGIGSTWEVEMVMALKAQERVEEEKKILIMTEKSSQFQFPISLSSPKLKTVNTPRISKLRSSIMFRLIPRLKPIIPSINRISLSVKPQPSTSQHCHTLRASIHHQFPSWTPQKPNPGEELHITFITKDGKQLTYEVAEGDNIFGYSTST